MVPDPYRTSDKGQDNPNKGGKTNKTRYYEVPYHPINILSFHYRYTAYF